MNRKSAPVAMLVVALVLVSCAASSEPVDVPLASDASSTAPRLPPELPA